jgi:hypothetical protein
MQVPLGNNKPKCRLGIGLSQILFFRAPRFVGSFAAEEYRWSRNNNGTFAGSYSRVGRFAARNLH